MLLQRNKKNIKNPVNYFAAYLINIGFNFGSHGTVNTGCLSISLS